VNALLHTRRHVMLGMTSLLIFRDEGFEHLTQCWNFACMPRMKLQVERIAGNNVSFQVKCSLLI
jgi:hypothetical protein